LLRLNFGKNIIIKRIIFKSELDLAKIRSEQLEILVCTGIILDRLVAGCSQNQIGQKYLKLTLVNFCIKKDVIKLETMDVILWKYLNGI
jgi:hypothetical protein